jgi:hypothetical protein
MSPGSPYQPLHHALFVWATLRPPVQERCRGMVENMQKLKVEMQGLVEAVRDKEELAKRLQSEFDKMPKEANRGIYTRRIMDIIKQVRKQKQGIAKVSSPRVEEGQWCVGVGAEKGSILRSLAPLLVAPWMCGRGLAVGIVWPHSPSHAVGCGPISGLKLRRAVCHF